MVQPQSNPVPPVQPMVQPQSNPVPPVQPMAQPQNNMVPPTNNMNQQYNSMPPQNGMNYNQPQGTALKAVNKLTYCLLAFFVGGIGIHKFYAGKTTAGILYIVFCWTLIPSFIAFVEFIIGITKQADANGDIYL